ncbi:MAG TPA: hypothetical protein VLL73_03815 [Desulfurivibrionaceae bacterium]|nr:hypothetical protein [Desulfurivibrionaceae bacterium]
MLIPILLLVVGLAALAAGFPLAQRCSGLRGIVAAAAVLAGTISIIGGVILLIVPNFFVS